MKYYTLFFSVLFFIGVKSQQIDYSNTRPGEDVEYCTTHKKLQELLQDPEYRKQFEQEQNQFRNEEAIYLKSARKRGTVYTIPVVFHVLHSGGVENISDEQIYDALAILNRDFRLQNTDAKTVHSDFAGLPTDVEIEFKMATIAPNGACFKGITRTYTTDETTAGDSQVSIIRNGNNVYKGEWTGNKYLHFFICKSVGGAAGYTFRPFGSGNSMTNGIWILHNYVGSIGTSNDIKSRALTHEVGHWLNLMHTWGGNNNPGNIASCDDPLQDEVDDTPKTKGVTFCNLDENSCGPRANVENYMDYSYCSKMFTPKQVARMRTALLSSIGGRNIISSANNLKAVGVTIPKLCGAEFKVDRKTVCLGNTVNFTDISYNSPTNWNWSFPGGTPTTSNEKNPKVIYNQPGVYSATLTISNSSNSQSFKMDTAVVVLDGSKKITYLESFNSITKINESPFWSTTNIPENNRFEVIKGYGYTDNNCLFLNNFSDNEKSSDELISGSLDLSNVKSSNEITIQFRYAFAKSTSTNLEVLRLSLSDDCGETWSVKKSMTSSSLSSIVSPTSWYPSSEKDWKTFTLTGITSNYWTKDFRFKIDFQGNGGNNLFIDDINIYPTAPQNEIVVGLDKVDESNLLISPNPVDNQLQISTLKDNVRITNYRIIDLTGKIICNENVTNLNQTSNFEINTSNLNSGSYLLQLDTNEGAVTKHFVVK